MKDANVEWIEEQCIKIDNEMTTGRSKKAFNTLRTLTATNQPKARVVADADGYILTVSRAGGVNTAATF